MKHVLLICLIIALLVEGTLLVQQHSSVAVHSSSTCTDIAASPDYLASRSESDAIAAINHARSLEHLHALRIPANYYTLDPVEQQFTLINLERGDRGLQPLGIDQTLSNMAQAYSKQLLDLDFFSHTSPIGGTFNERINANPALASHYSEAAENLAGNPVAGAGAIYEYMYDDTVEDCGHRKNILDPTLNLVGIGWINGSQYGSISAQEFISSASWNPYQPDTIKYKLPHISIQVKREANSSLLYCQAFAEGMPGGLRITWFLDNLNKQLHLGSNWELDLSHLQAGQHMLLAYVVDGGQNYAVARYKFVI